MSDFKIHIESALGNKTLLSTAELAKKLCCKPQTIRKWLSQNKLPEWLPMPIKINSRNYWSSEDVNNALLAQLSKGKS
ncbi:helix-turn-helix transcriptional regulator [Aeromonas media]|uniref:helix-turn-helix transcriptional regulator n=1 Tax=Aeromonas media TaxID=651 RepID=UPI00111A0D0C|nr:helix-turn-helix domain-containing protein [Aeromonas media]TNI73170.1 DNA-binding protein [Aeromonas media]